MRIAEFDEFEFTFTNNLSVAGLGKAETVVETAPPISFISVEANAADEASKLIISSIFFISQKILITHKDKTVFFDVTRFLEI